MLLRLTYVTFVIFVCIQITVGQSYNSKKDISFTSGASDSDSRNPVQPSGYPAPLNKVEDIEADINPRKLFNNEPFPSTGCSSAISSTYQTSPLCTTNPSPVESFITELNSAVYDSNTLPEIFDLRELSTEAFAKSMYDYVHAYATSVSHDDPHYIASMAANPLNEGIKSFTFPIILDIYANTIAKFLFAKDALNSYNAASLARKYAKVMEETSKNNWVKEYPESKFLVLENGFKDYMSSIGILDVGTVEDVAVIFRNEVKRVAKNL